MNSYRYNADSTRTLTILLKDSVELVDYMGSIYRAVVGIDVSKSVITLADGSKYKLSLTKL